MIRLRVFGEIDAVEVARARQINHEFFLNAPGMRRKKKHAIAETGRFANIVRDEDDRLVARFPDALDVAVKLLAGERIERGEWFVHQEHARIRRERARERDALFHSAGKLVNVRVFESS